MSTLNIQLITPSTPAELLSTRRIFKEYATQLGVHLCFQNFAAELESLPGDYADPQGSLLLALVDGEPAGCCAMRGLNSAGYPNACEMKRLYVRAAHRGLGLGRQLAEAVMDAARIRGHRHMLLDTLTEMDTARALYQYLGFEEIPPYHYNLIAGAHHLKVDLQKVLQPNKNGRKQL